ncbi:MAG: hypothetical protein LBN23_00865, partial [Paludibacter sp.]|nr:hypothetical protein [Paludibacter sp.]
QRVIVGALLPDGLEAAALVDITPKILPAPRFLSLPRIADDSKGVKKVEYALDLDGRADLSEITWYRCKNANGDGAIPVLVSRQNKPETFYALTAADEGYYLMASVRPKHIRSDYGDEKRAVSPQPIPARQAAINEFSTDFHNFPVDFQPNVIAGFWTVDNYRPESFTNDEKWTAPREDRYWNYGAGYDAARGVFGLFPTAKGARILYTPAEKPYKDMSISLLLTPCKSAGQGFGMAGQYLDIYIKYDTKTQSGYGLRIIRTIKSARAVDFVLMKYENGKATPISGEATSGCFRSNCSIKISVAGNKLTVHAETSALDTHEFPNTVDLTADIAPNAFGGAGLHFTGTAGANSTVFRNMKIVW